jgi:hypothetical protein
MLSRLIPLGEAGYILSEQLNQLGDVVRAILYFDRRVCAIEG